VVGIVYFILILPVLLKLAKWEVFILTWAHLLQDLLQVIVGLSGGVFQLGNQPVNLVEDKTGLDALHPSLLEDSLCLKEGGGGGGGEQGKEGTG